MDHANPESGDSPELKEMEDFIINLPLFECLSRDSLKIVATHMRFKTLEAGETLFNEWDRADYACFIERGALDVMQKSGPDTYSILRTLPRGRSLGEMSIIDNFPRKTTARAREDTRLGILSQSKFQSILQKHPSIGIDILKSLARLMSVQLKKTSSRLTDYMFVLE
jgi:CRP/FNR family cyclic AMP-dependent transcriptional regulator